MTSITYLRTRPYSTLSNYYPSLPRPSTALSTYYPPTYHYYGLIPDPCFVSTALYPDQAETRIREFAEYQFREKSYYLGLDPLYRARSPVYINTAKMMAIWRSARLNPLSPGVNFSLGYNKKIVAYDAV